MEGNGSYCKLEGYVVVKEEPPWEGARRRRTGREIDRDTTRETIVCSDHGKETIVKEEDDECELSAAQAALYAGHKVKGELVLGPEGPQPGDAAFALHDATQTVGDAGWFRRELALSFGHRQESLVARDCAVTRKRSSTPDNSSAADKSDRENEIHDNRKEGTTEGNYMCFICRKKFALLTNLMEHTVIHMEVKLERSRAVEAMVSSVPRGTPGQHSNHTMCAGNKTHSRIEIESVIAGTEEDVYACSMYRGKFALKSSLKEHVVVHIDKPRSPEQGGKHGSDSALLVGARAMTCGKPPAPSAPPRTHTQAPTNNKRLQSCDICHKQFTRSNYLHKHRRIHTGVKLYACEICKKHFTQSSTLNIHRRIHTGDKPYPCDKCNKQFTASGYLHKHRRIHTGEKPYPCEICAKQFTESSTLKIHRRIHTGEKPYACKLCNQQFTTSSHLNTHRRIHTGEKPYSCEICKKLFTKSSSLKIHRLIHTGEKPYACKLCNKRFTTSSHLNTHRRIHTGEKPYSCEICKKLFTQSSSLKVHRRIHTGEKPYACKLCNKQFTTSSHLNTHRRRHTGENLTLVKYVKNCSLNPVA